ncbi:helix-turn-helix domain-containing protein [Pedobacter sp.]|uniref:helix-turn-helix domain-containing protein n=1 Tax=Pedobacter sp. TaxID=1411316 RepID=UPI003D7FDA2D
MTNDYLGISAGQLIRDRVILEAKRLLINMKLSIADISIQLDFNDQSYFIKFFKKHTGTTPSIFRKQNL